MVWKGLRKDSLDNPIRYSIWLWQWNSYIDSMIGTHSSRFLDNSRGYGSVLKGRLMIGDRPEPEIFKK